MRVSLFITCLVDRFAPEIGVAMVKVLRQAGCEVDFPEAQTCCGQPGFNSGYQIEARGPALHFLNVFETAEYVVAPSGSCVAMVRVFYRDLFINEPENLARAEKIAAKTFEFSEFLTEILQIKSTGAEFAGKIALHKSCHLLRELKVEGAAEKLLTSVKDAEVVPLERADVCCGFGGLFAIKFPEISGAIMQDKIDCIKKSGANTIVACDQGCLMHIAGGLSRQKSEIKTRHLAEILAQNVD